jgi:pilus assembly protein CpaD
MIGRPIMPPARARQGSRFFWRAMLVLAAAFASAGCSMTAKEETTASIPRDYRLRHPIAVREGDRTMEVFIGTRRGGLTPTQRTEIAAFANVWRRESSGGIIIDVPSGTPNARAASAAVREVRSLLASAGVPPRAMVSRAYRPSDPEELATVRLQYPKMVGQVGPCGMWPEDLGLTYNSQPTMNRPYWNLGCASQRNLAAMVDNPADLVQPRADTPIYAARRATALDKYRKGESSATIYPDATKGTISDVGK